jgi:mannose-6-phosphate isomerase-like protein (cupin superfamily)
MPQPLGLTKGAAVLDRVIDTSDFKSSHQEAWFGQKLASFGGASLRYRVMRDTCAQFHVHENCPEGFFVPSGVVHIDTEAGTVSLAPGQFFEVQPGLRHRARVEGGATLLVFDGLPH